MLRSLLCVTVFLLGACGQSGALVLPDKESPPPKQVAPSATPADDSSSKPKKNPEASAAP